MYYKNAVNFLENSIRKAEQYQDWSIENIPCGHYNREKLEWILLRHKRANIKSHGWKIHVSAHCYNAKNILDAIIDSLLEQKVCFKIPASTNFLLFLSNPVMSKQQAGKFITIYSELEEQAYRIAKILHEKTISFSSPSIITDKRFMPNSIIYYRYGAFSAAYVQTLWGGFISTMRIDNKTVFDTKNPDDKIYKNIRNPFLKNEPTIIHKNSNHGLTHSSIIKYLKLSGNHRSQVHLCLDKNNFRRCILKTAFSNSSTDSLGNSAITRVQYEANILKKIERLEIAPKCYDEYFNENKDYCLVMEDLAGEPLHAYLTDLTYTHRRISIKKAIRLSTILAKYLALLHQHQIVHGDLKLSNIMIMNHLENLRLIDFDSSCDFEHNRFIATAGSMGYTTLNRYLGNIPCQQDDIYSYGACLYYLFTGIDPENNPLEVDQKDISNSLFDRNTPIDIQSLIRFCLSGQIKSFEYIVRLLENRTIYSRKQHEFPVIQSKPYQDKLAYLTNCILNHGYQPESLGFDFNRIITGHIEINDLRGMSGMLLALSVLVINGYETKQIQSAIKDCSRQLINYHPDYNLIPGLYAGESGKALALLYAALSIQDRSLYQSASLIMDKANQIKLQSFDLYNGAAGCMRANLIFYAVSKDKKYLANAKKIAQYLLSSVENFNAYYGWYNPRIDSTCENFTLNTQEIQLGYSHGMAGICDALLDHYLLSQDKKILDVLTKNTNFFINSAELILKGKGVGWPIKVGGALTLPYWCHGGGGIGLFLSRMMSYELCAVDLPFLKKIVHAMITCTRGGPNLLCHGVLGNLEIFLDLNYFQPKLLLNKTIVCFEDICSVWLKHYTNNQLKTQNVNFDHYGYLTGIAGSLTVYSRLQNRCIPNPMQVEYANYLIKMREPTWLH